MKKFQLNISKVTPAGPKKNLTWQGEYQNSKALKHFIYAFFHLQFQFKFLTLMHWQQVFAQHSQSHPPAEL